MPANTLTTSPKGCNVELSLTSWLAVYMQLECPLTIVNGKDILTLCQRSDNTGTCLLQKIFENFIVDAEEAGLQNPSPKLNGTLKGQFHKNQILPKYQKSAVFCRFLDYLIFKKFHLWQERIS